jgi:hypothetical protein
MRCNECFDQIVIVHCLKASRIQQLAFITEVGNVTYWFALIGTNFLLNKRDGNRIILDAYKHFRLAFAGSLKSRRLVKKRI